jgi:hypothetical protein
VYFKPPSTGATTSYHTGDDRWKRQNNIPSLTTEFSGEIVFMVLDPDNFWLVLPENIHGTHQRLTGITGGYYDRDTGEYKNTDGTVTTRAVAFPDNIGYCHHSGMRITLDDAFTSALYNDSDPEAIISAFDTASAFSRGGFTWYIPDLNELGIFMEMEETVPATNNTPFIWSGARQKLTSTTYKGNTAQCWVYQLQGYPFPSNKTAVKDAVLIGYWA